MNNTSDEGGILFGVDNVLYEIYLQNTIFYGNSASDSLISIENTVNIYFINTTFIMSKNLLFSASSSKLKILSSVINDVECSNFIPACLALVNDNSSLVIQNTLINNVNHLRAEGGIQSTNSYIMISNASLRNMKTSKQIGSCFSGSDLKLDIISIVVQDYDANCIFLEKSSLFLNNSYFNNIEQNPDSNFDNKYGTIRCKDCISLVLSFTLFEHNDYVENGGALTLSSLNFVVQNLINSCIFQSIKAKNKGGVLLIDYTNLQIYNSSFFGNEASEGGAIFYQG